MKTEIQRSKSGNLLMLSFAELEESPLVRTGQGDYTRDVMPSPPTSSPALSAAQIYGFIIVAASILLVAFVAPFTALGMFLTALAVWALL